MKRRIALLLAAVTVTTSLAGCGACGSGDGNTAQTTETTETTQQEETGETAEETAVGSAEDTQNTGYPIVQPGEMPDIEVFKSVADLEPEDPNENLWMQKATADTGVTFNWTTVPGNSAGERVAMMLATNDLPDVFWNGVTRDQVLQYMNAGIFMPVEDLVDQYMPNLKKIFEERPQYKAMCTAPDGHMYGFPRVEEMNGLTSTPGGVYVNQEWLDQIGAEVPSTLDEWVDMLYAFKEAGDLNGNGEADEWPLSWDYAEGWDNIFAWVSGCYGTPDVSNGPLNSQDGFTNHLFVKDNKIGYAPTEESFQKTAELFHQFYVDGILNPDSFAPTTSGTSLHKQKLQQDLPMLGTFMAWGRDGNITNRDVMAQYVAQPRVEGPAGKSGYVRNTSELSTTSLGMITVECENPEIVARFIDYCYAPANSVTLNWGAEDFVYKKDENGILRWDVDADGNVIFKNDFTEFWQMREHSTIGGPNIVLNDYYDTVVEYPRDAQTLYDEQVACGKKELLEEYTPVTPRAWFLPEEQAQIDQLLPQINNVVDATVQRWIIDGGADTESEQFKADLDAAGLQTFLGVWQAAYDRYLDAM